jgi:two-component system, OmpR family, response regulator ChvI
VSIYLIHTQATKRRILIVDDEPDITFVFKMGLEDNGFVVDTFNDPQLALSNFKNGLYDLLLIDIGIPKMNGFEFYREIKKIDHKAKVYFLTAGETFYGAHQDIFDTLDANCFIRKPVENKEVIARLNKIIN